jgi:hypothetical protein
MNRVGYTLKLNYTYMKKLTLQPARSSNISPNITYDLWQHYPLPITNETMAYNDCAQAEAAFIVHQHGLCSSILHQSIISAELFLVKTVSFIYTDFAKCNRRHPHMRTHFGIHLHKRNNFTHPHSHARTIYIYIYIAKRIPYLCKQYISVQHTPPYIKHMYHANLCYQEV